MTTRSLAEIVADARALSTIAEKAQFLKANNSKELRNILVS